MKKYIFFDRDGTLIEHVHHLVDIDQVVIIKEAGPTLRFLKNMGYSFGIITNQSVVGLGLTKKKTVDDINRKICSFFEKYNVYFDLVKVCYHSKNDGCPCRKPAIGLLDLELKLNLIDRQHSFMVGDQETDVIFGKNIGVRTIRISTNETMTTEADFLVKNLESIPKVIQS